jgi:hypothetical protein
MLGPLSDLVSIDALGQPLLLENAPFVNYPGVDSGAEGRLCG